MAALGIMGKKCYAEFINSAIMLNVIGLIADAPIDIIDYGTIFA